MEVLAKNHGLGGSTGETSRAWDRLKKWKGGESFQIFGFACAFARFRTVNITLKGRRSVKTAVEREPGGREL